MPIERRNPGKRSPKPSCSRRGGERTVYLAGQVADDRDANMTTQTKQVLASIDRLLAEVGSDKSRLLSATIYLPDMADFPTLNAIWEQWVVGGADASARDGAGCARASGLQSGDPGG